MRPLHLAFAVVSFAEVATLAEMHEDAAKRLINTALLTESSNKSAVLVFIDYINYIQGRSFVYSGKSESMRISWLSWH